MSLFDHFSRPRRREAKATPQQKMILNREELQHRLNQASVECGAQNELAHIQIERALNKGRRAVKANDPRLKAIAMSELRMAAAMVKYTDALSTNIMMMESNLRMQAVTVGFSELVDRISRLKMPAGTVDFNELTRKALKGLQPVDLMGVEEFTKDLIEASLSATHTSSMPDAELEALINGNITVDELLAGSAAMTDDQAAPQTAQTADEATAAASDDDLLKMLEEITESLKTGG